MDPPVASLDIRGNQRSEDDICHIVTFLQTIPLLCELFTHELLYELACFTYYQYFRSANTVVYQEGDSIVNFYLVLDGTLSEIMSPRSVSHHYSSRNDPRYTHSHSHSNMNPEPVQDPTVVKLLPGDVFGFEDANMQIQEDVYGDTIDGERGDGEYGVTRSLNYSSTMTPSRAYPFYPSFHSSTSYYDRSHLPDSHVDGSILTRRSTVLTESPCRLLFINWWQFRSIFYQKGYFKIASARVEFLQHIHHTFSMRLSLQQPSQHQWSEYSGYEDNVPTNNTTSVNTSLPQKHFSSSQNRDRASSARRRRRHHRTNQYSERMSITDENISHSQYPTALSPSASHSVNHSATHTPSHSSSNRKEIITKKEEVPPSPSVHTSNNRHGTHTTTLSAPSNVPTCKVVPPDDTSADLTTDIAEEAGALSISEITPPTPETFNLIECSTKLYQRIAPPSRPGNVTPRWNGIELTQWLSKFLQSEDRILLRGVWQYLLDEAILIPVVEGQKITEIVESREPYFQFSSSITQGNAFSSLPPCDDDILITVVRSLLKFAPDAAMSVIFRRSPTERSSEELDFIYNEVMNLRAFSHLSNMVKRELASVLELEKHMDATGKVVFRQGDKGTYWYIILKGSVDVHIAGKGVVTSLKEGDEFGKLALINNAPRAATIIIKEKMCYLLKVCKEEFDRILLDVEANTVRLKEHGKDVLLLARADKSDRSESSNSGSTQNYSIIAGVAEKIVEYLLETKVSVGRDFPALQNTMKEAKPGEFKGDSVIRHLIYAYPIFLTTEELCELMVKFVKVTTSSQTFEKSNKNLDNQRKAVIIFLWMWFYCLPHQFAEEDCLDEAIVHCLSHLDHQRSATQRNLLGKLLESCRMARHNLQMERATSKIKTTLKPSVGGQAVSNRAISQMDPITMDVYLPNKTRRQITLAANASVQMIVKTVLGDADEEKAHNARLCEVKSSGEIVIFKNSDLGVYFRIGYNSFLFVASPNEMKELTPLPQQLTAMDSSANYLELVNVDDFAAAFCHYDWEQLMNIRTHELLYASFGREQFSKISPNLDCMIRRFSRVQYWVVSEVVSAQNMHKRATLLRKLIKLAHTLLQLKDMNTFIAIIMGLSHASVTRLRNTWDKLPGKQQKMMKEFTALLDSSRNHRLLREKLQTVQAPFVPYMPLLMKDLAFVHERNQSQLEDGLVNFEKVQLIGKCIAQFEESRSLCNGVFLGPQKRDRSYEDMRHFIENITCIEDQRRLTNLSLKLEAKK